MLKKPENKTRKRLRITQCVFYLLQIFLCTFPVIRFPKPDEPGQYLHRTLFDMFGYMFSSYSDEAVASAFKVAIPFFLLLLINPIVGFFFCAIDKERNLKNIVSVVCCLLGVFSTLTFIPINMLGFGAILSLIFYIFISFITTIAMMARLVDDSNTNK